jgi:hypothetical protein
MPILAQILASGTIMFFGRIEKEDDLLPFMEAKY